MNFCLLFCKLWWVAADLQEQQLDIEFPLDDEIKQLISTLDDYEDKKKTIEQNLKKNDYWPEVLKKPSKFRKFYIKKDLSSCGFGINER